MLNIIREHTLKLLQRMKEKIEVEQLVKTIKAEIKEMRVNEFWRIYK